MTVVEPMDNDTGINLQRENEVTCEIDEQGVYEIATTGEQKEEYYIDPVSAEPNQYEGLKNTGDFSRSCGIPLEPLDIPDKESKSSFWNEVSAEDYSTLSNSPSNDLEYGQAPNLGLYVSIKDNSQPFPDADEVDNEEDYDDIAGLDCKIKEKNGTQNHLPGKTNSLSADSDTLFRRIQNEPFREIVNSCSEGTGLKVRQPVQIPRKIFVFIVVLFFISVASLVIIILHLVGVLKATNDKSNEVDTLTTMVNQLKNLVSKMNTTKT